MGAVVCKTRYEPDGSVKDAARNFLCSEKARKGSVNIPGAKGGCYGVAVKGGHVQRQRPVPDALRHDQVLRGFRRRLPVVKGGRGKWLGSTRAIRPRKARSAPAHGHGRERIQSAQQGRQRDQGQMRFPGPFKVRGPR